MTAPTPERLRELLARALEGVTVNASGCVSYPTETAHLSVSFLAKHGAALLHQLAELDAEIATLRTDVETLVKMRQHQEDRAEAAERARDEATGLLRDAFDSIIKAAALAGIDPIPAPEPNSIGGRIAAFLAASGGK